MKKHVYVNGKEFELEVKNAEGKRVVLLGNRKFEVEVMRRKIDGKSFAVINREGVEFFILKKGKYNYLVVIDGKEYEVEIGRKRKEGEKEAENFVVAPMPGIITGVKIKKGEEVKKGMPLLTMESMKMQIEITSSSDGKVEELFVKEGDSVRKGDKLVVIK